MHAGQALASPVGKVERSEKGYRVPGAQLCAVHILCQHPREDGQGDAAKRGVGTRWNQVEQGKGQRAGSFTARRKTVSLEDSDEAGKAEAARELRS